MSTITVKDGTTITKTGAKARLSRFRMGGR
jgi:hypothetical protein